MNSTESVIPTGNDEAIYRRAQKSRPSGRLHHWGDAAEAMLLPWISRPQSLAGFRGNMKSKCFSWLQNSRSGGGSQGRPKGAAPVVGAKCRAFTDDRSGGYRAAARRDASSAG